MAQRGGPSGTYIENFPANQPVSFADPQHVIVDSLPGGASSVVDVSDRTARVLGHVIVDSAPAAGADVTDRTARLLGHVTVDNASLAVTGTFWQTTQPVSGTFWQSTQPVSLASLPALVAGSALIGKVGIDQTTPGTTNGVQVTNSSLAVTGSFWQATQPVSAASLPLPSGAATSANQPAINADGGALAHISNTSVAVTGTFWQATQPVSGTFWQATQPISASALPLPSGAAADATLTGGTQQTKLTDGTNVASVKAASTSAIATDKAVVVAVSPNNSVAVTGTFFQATQPVSGTFWQTTQPVSGTFWQATQPISAAALPLPSGAAADATLTGGTVRTKITDGTNNAAVKAASTAAVAADPAQVVAISPNNSVAVTGTFWQATQPVSGTFWQATQPISAASLPLPTGAAADATLTGGTQRNRITDGTNNVSVKAASTPAVAADVALVVAQSPNTYAASVARLVSAAASINATVVKASAGRLFKVRGYNAAAAVRYIKFFNKTTTPAPASDAALILLSVALKASDVFDIDLGALGFAFSTGIGFTMSTGSADTDVAALTAADVVGLNVLYT